MSYVVHLVTRPPEEIKSTRWKVPLGKCDFCPSEDGQITKSFMLHKSGMLDALGPFMICKKCREWTMKPADKAAKARATLTLVEEDMFLWKDQNEEELF